MKFCAASIIMHIRCTIDLYSVISAVPASFMSQICKSGSLSAITKKL